LTGESDIPASLPVEDILMSANHSYPSKRRMGRRRWTPCFEAVVCRLDGSRVRGIAYRRGRVLTGDACNYQFGRLDTDTEALAASVGDASLTQAVLERLGVLLTPAEIDLLYLRYVAGWSPAAMAPEWHRHRGTITRQEKRIVALLCQDPVLQQLMLSARWRATRPC
jgi:hypothetical protein